MSSRRSVIRGIGAAGVVGLFGTTTAAGDDGLPSTVRGERIYEFTPNGDTYRRTERFVSDEMAAEYGVRELEFETIEFPSTEIADQRRGEAFTKSQVEETVIGTFSEHLRREERLREAISSDDLSDDYYGPLYHYNASPDNPDPEDLGEPKAPINLAWNDDLGEDVSSVKGTFDWAPWDDPTGTYPIKTDRYITFYWNGTEVVNSTDAHVMDEINYSEQWHIRLYSATIAADDYSVVGQAHYDPLNHNKLISISDWKFDGARGEALSDWKNQTSHVSVLEDINNGSRFDSADGQIGRLHLYDGLDK